MDILTRLEEVILVAIWKLKENAYGVSINEKVSELFRKEYSMGALYFSLDQLTKKGYTQKRQEESTERKKGRAKTYYSLSIEGRQALQLTREHQLLLMEETSDLLPVEK